MAGDKDVKVTIVLDNELWKRTKIQAIREERDLKELVTEALERYLSVKEKKGSHGPG
jgi:hypothetical protein